MAVLRNFSIKFVDIMIGVVLGVGFQWWPDLKEVWQYLAFLFVYLNLIDYWIDYSPTIKKFPLKRELDVILHTFIIFSMFFLIFNTSNSLSAFLLAFVLYRILDIVWIWRMKTVYRASAYDKKFLNSWGLQDIYEVAFTLLLLLAFWMWKGQPLYYLLIFIALRVLTRIMASLRYKKIYYS
ncbi:MAG: hypothetical protein ABIB97_01900 [Patescibacteria group bacterium]